MLHRIAQIGSSVGEFLVDARYFFRVVTEAYGLGNDDSRRESKAKGDC
jgi:hypothetical protein